MGLRGEVFSTKVTLQNRTYFFNVKENRLGDLYLNIVESKNRDEGGFERQSVILFAEDLQEFLKGFDESLRVLEKSVRDKRRGTDKRSPEKSSSRRAPPRQNEGGKDYDSPPPRRKRDDSRGPSFRDKPEGSRGSAFRDRPESSRGSSFRDRSEGPRGSSFRDKPEGSRGSAFRDKPERRGERPGRPSKDQKDFSDRKKRVVIKRK